MGKQNTDALHVARRIDLDYLEPSLDLLENLSGCAANGPHIWTVSDEGRTVECLERYNNGYRLYGRIHIDQLIGGIPGSQDDELDMESLDFAGGALWLCGAHCKVRRKPQAGELVDPEIRQRKSRRLLARITFDGEGRTPVKADWLPFEGDGSLREALENDLFLSPYQELPTKENGIDIEGMAVLGEQVFVGLRGPMVGGFAVVVELTLGDDFRIASFKRHFLKLDGLAVRELARDDASLLIIAGPVGEERGPFALYRWNPNIGVAAAKIFAWNSVAEKPEGMCLTAIDGERGLLLLYDSPATRISGATFEADWFNGV